MTFCLVEQNLYYDSNAYSKVKTASATARIINMKDFI